MFRLGALAILSLFGCDKLGTKQAAVDAAASTSAEAPVAKAAASASAASAGGGVIEGLGEVPAWSPDKPSPKCVVSAEARAKLKPIDKGDDAALSAGTADIPALSKSVGADTCFAARKALAEALNDGGFAKYRAKKYDEADRFWRAALTARPALNVARYNLACGLALAGKPKDAVSQIEELARAAKEDDAGAANFLEKAKGDDDLKSVRADAAFKKALEASNAGLVGPRKEPETAAKAVAVLPDEFRKVKDEVSGNGGFVTYKPAALSFWTWRPSGANELLVATLIDDPAKLGKPKGDMNQDYGAIAVYRREGDKLKLLISRKTGESPPSVAAGKNASVAYSFEAACGTLKGNLTWNGQAVEVHEKTCADP